MLRPRAFKPFTSGGRRMVVAIHSSSAFSRQ